MPRCLHRFEQCCNNENHLPDKGSVQIDDTILRISTILKRARNIKNCLAPINQLPPEILAHVVAFLPTERDLISATAACQHWRTTLLSFPRLWRNVGGSSSEIQAYIERSKSTPIGVTLSSPELAELIVPHTSRLVGLTIQLNDLPSLCQVVEHLHSPIPTLRVFRIITDTPELHTLEFHSDLQGPFFLHSKKLEIEGISAFHAYQAFPHVTEFTLHTNAYHSTPMDPLLRMLEQFPALERIHITFYADLHTKPTPHMVTLPHVQEMSLSASSWGKVVRIPHILQFLRLPNLTSLCLRAMPKLATFRPVFPVTKFDEHLPNLVELPELQIELDMLFSEATFRGPSQAILKYLIGPLSSYDLHERIFWRELPLHSVRRLTVNMVFPPSDQALEWLVGLLRDLKFLEGLELGGECDRALSRLRYCMSRGDISLRIQTLIVHRGGYARTQALVLKDLIDATGLNVTLICPPDPEVQEGREVETETRTIKDTSFRPLFPKKRLKVQGERYALLGVIS